MRYVIKRNGEKEDFESYKIFQAVMKAMQEVNQMNFDLAQKVTSNVTSKLFNSSNVVSVDLVHDIVENELMDLNMNDVAKEYIVYRAKHKPNIFSKRTNLKPYEYPQLAEYVDAIRHSYWVHTEFNFTSDIQDMKVNLTPVERQAVTRAMLAISQIEVAVKNFWGDIYKKLPKPEIGAVGSTFAESEVRHADAYSNLIKVMGLNNEFETLMEVPSIRKRIKFLEKTLNGSVDVENRDYFESIILFSMFVENVSLFSQFLVIMSFNKFKNVLKGMSNAVEATSKEEKIHADFGFDLVNTIKAENPDWWTESLVNDIIDSTFEAYEAEKGIVDWMFESGDLEFLNKEQTVEFIKHRYNLSLNSIGIDNVFKVNEELLRETEWFDDEILATKHTDFFNKRSINYTKRSKSVTEEDLF